METDEVPEETMRERERQEVKDLIKAQGVDGSVDKGANQTGMYELCGESSRCAHNRTGETDDEDALPAIVTHKGNSADSGHYIGWTRQPTEENGIPGEEDWWKFDGESGSCSTFRNAAG